MARSPSGTFNELATQIHDSGNEPSLRVLMLDHDDAPTRLLLKSLHQAGFPGELVGSQADLITRMQQEYYRLLVVNPALTRPDAATLITALRQQSPGTEILLIAEMADIAAAVAAVRAGAMDYLARPVPTVRLLELVGGALRRGIGIGSLQEITQPPGYHILRVIATGDVSTVMLVAHVASRQHYAMKILVNSESAGGTGLAAVKRFFREAKILASIDHPHVVKIVEYGFSAENVPYLIMEYVEGQPLTDLIRDDGFDLLRRLLVIEQIAKALATVHERGVLHRDLRPCNVLVTPQHLAKLADFGLAHIADSTLTMAREALGPPAYLAPEAWDDPAAADERSDLFALGVMAYELLTRRRPFSGKTLAQLRESVHHGRPVAPHKLNPEVGPELAEIMARLLAKRPEERWPQASAVVDALQRCHERRSGLGWRVVGLLQRGSPVWQ